MLKNQTIDNLRLDGGILCLDFVNTVPDRYDGSDRDTLTDFNDLIYWARKADIIDKGCFALLEKSVQTNPKKAKEFFDEAIDIRHLVYSLFHPISQGKKAKPVDIDAFNKLKIKYFQFLEIVFQKNSFTERWNLPSGHFFSITAPIVRSAYELLFSPKLGRIKECPKCGWLFFDTTKNGKRKWCSMEDCGSKVKALEWYYQHKN